MSSRVCRCPSSQACQIVTVFRLSRGGGIAVEIGCSVAGIATVDVIVVEGRAVVDIAGLGVVVSRPCSVGVILGFTAGVIVCVDPG